ncbi:histidinol dehydrogenase [Thalassotalea sp. 1_MG-2023]|uniref:histidinol dehydrogenase n=1 Tax=Thalassotalea sp. 1_MG-2023 TaxID=3062680 RepID=UPI0026E22F37|nr:histidinol dehydrogenase [Thalassotalea sp. 1_MG-2023]MDO6427862.1 histidinol dehydrogenase [Thalassotalea sp. 1_MG-2023]
MSIRIINWSSLNKQEKRTALMRPALAESDLLATQVANIINEVKAKGDEALYNFCQRFDGVTLTNLRVNDEQINQAIASLSESRLAAIETAYQQIKRFHQAQQPTDITVETTPGVVCTLKTEAIESVGLYIPAGSAPLPSTALMLGVPAQLAGCHRKVLVSPPDKQGNIAPEVLAAAKLCGIDEIYAVGGAQACAALAYGTDSIAPVNKIFGPGNKYVTEAKTQLSQHVFGFAIDMPAGPSEVLVIADEHANPAFVAADLLSQAEHGPDSQVILLSDSKVLIEQVNHELTKQVSVLSRKAIALEALKQSRLILTENLAQACEVSNLYGPEHLIIQTDNAEQLLSSLRNAGSIFVGAYTPESAGDYASGTNHVLPTYGYSKVVSSLSLADFSRRFTVQQLTREGLANIADCIKELTDAEGLDAHKRAVTIRLEETTA